MIITVMVGICATALFALLYTVAEKYEQQWIIWNPLRLQACEGAALLCVAIAIWCVIRIAWSIF